MPDLLAINLHLQRRLERDWRDEVRAPEAARWLDEAGLLPDRKVGLPLRNLLRVGRIAGQEQRPDRKNGKWFIRRLAESRDPGAIPDARERLRRCLPVDRGAFPHDWPVNQGPPEFWQELGKTIAAFGHLERMLASTCHALLTTSERVEAFLASPTKEAASRWARRLLSSRVDPMHGLISELDKVLREAGHVPHAVREDLVSDLRVLRPWRNALCHGAWLDIDEDGCGHLEHFFKEHRTPVPFEPKLALEDLSGIRAMTVDLTFRVADAASISGPLDTQGTGAGYALAVDMPRMREPRRAPPDT